MPCIIFSVEYPEKSKISNLNMKNLKVWIVDDDPDLNEVYVEYLSEFFDVSRGFCSPKEAILTLKNIPSHEMPDLMMVDQMMPEMDGLTLCQEISKLRVPVAILMISGMDSGVSAQDAELLNIVGVLRKPCPSRRIYEEIYRYGAFKTLCKEISSEILTLCRNGNRAEKLDWEFFLGQHADLEKAFGATSGKKTDWIAAVQNVERQIHDKGIVLPPNSRLEQLFDQFRKEQQ